MSWAKIIDVFSNPEQCLDSASSSIWSSADQTFFRYPSGIGLKYATATNSVRTTHGKCGYNRSGSANHSRWPSCRSLCHGAVWGVRRSDKKKACSRSFQSGESVAASKKLCDFGNRGRSIGRRTVSQPGHVVPARQGPCEGSMELVSAAALLPLRRL